MNDTKPVVVGLGEILWDMFPDGKQLGGAPANFAFHAQCLGAAGAVASAVGDDELGARSSPDSTRWSWIARTWRSTPPIRRAR